MKITLHEGLAIAETEIEVRCHVADKRLKRLLDYIRQYSFSLEGRMDEASFFLPSEEVIYMDSVDGRTFLYSGKNVYESRETLTSLEEKLVNTTFVRISKNCIVNTAWLKSVSPLWNHRLEAHLKNGENLIVSRNYIAALKEKLSR